MVSEGAFGANLPAASVVGAGTCPKLSPIGIMPNPNIAASIVRRIFITHPLQLDNMNAFHQGERLCKSTISTNPSPFQRSSKRRKGFPSESRVKRGHRIVNGHKELIEKLGRRDLCPCGSGRSFQKVLPRIRPLRRIEPPLLFSANDSESGSAAP